MLIIMSLYQNKYNKIKRIWWIIIFFLCYNLLWKWLHGNISRLLKK
jgi:hypothetical protein